MIDFDPHASPNPFESPRAELETPLGALGYSHRFPAAELVDRGRLTREIYVPAPLCVNIAYHGLGVGYESVLADGILVCRKSGLLWFVPRFAFVLPTKAGEFAATLEVKVSWKFKIVRFCVRLEGEIIYAED